MDDFLVLYSLIAPISSDNKTLESTKTPSNMLCDLPLELGMNKRHAEIKRKMLILLVSLLNKRGVKFVNGGKILSFFPKLKWVS